MLLLALGAVVVGFAFLVVSLLSQDAVWAWGCIAACVVGAGFVVTDAVRRRQGSHAIAESGAGPGEPATDQAAPFDEHPGAPVVGVGEDRDGPDRVEVAPGPLDADTGPAEEAAEPAASLLLAGSSSSVLVVDEHPRFHVAGCTWLDGRTTMTLPVGEAAELGFTPCGWCTPVAHFAGAPPGLGSG